MSDHIGLLICVVVGCVIVAVAAYYIARFMRGSIKLFLARTAFAAGDTIAGSFKLNTKKSIQGNRVIVSLIGVQITKTREDGKTRTQSREIYRDAVLVEDAREYPAGYTATYNFAIAVPDTNMPEFMDSSLGRTLTTALNLLSNQHTQLKWKVEARLDAKGIDLATSTTVSINM